MKVLCINASNKPNDLPQSQWVVKGETYTVEKVGKDFAGVYFFFLWELKPDAPYLGFRADRFAEIEPEKVLHGQEAELETA